MIASSKLGWFYEQVCNILGTEESLATPGYLLGAIRTLQHYFEKRDQHLKDAELRKRLREALSRNGIAYSESASNDALIEDVSEMTSFLNQ